MRVFAYGLCVLGLLVPGCASAQAGTGANAQAAPAAAAAPSDEVAFGGIELASSSVKGLTFVFEPGGETDQGGQRPDRMRRLQYAERNASFISMKDGCRLNDRGVALLVKDTQEVVQELRDGAKAQNLAKLKLFVVASSGLGSVCNGSEIAAKVEAATGLCPEFISASDEAKYTLGFVLPRDRYRSLILDISGGNTLGGYYVTTRGAEYPPREWHSFELPFGARTLKDKALKMSGTPVKGANGNPLPAPTFYEAVNTILETEVRPALEQIKEENSGLDNFRQMYMVGGVVWATSTRTKPVQQETYAIDQLSVEDFSHVMDMIRNDTYNEFSSGTFEHTSPKTRDAAEQELEDVLQRFDSQSLYAGVALARFLLEHTAEGAKVYFPTTAAWISGYAREKFREGGAPGVAATCSAPPARSDHAAGQ